MSGPDTPRPRFSSDRRHSTPAIEVDFDALRRVASDLRDLAVEFADRNGSLQGLLDDPDLGPALRHAERDWWDQRRRIHAFLLGLSDAVTHGVETYADTESSVIAAEKGSGSHR